MTNPPPPVQWDSGCWKCGRKEPEVPLIAVPQEHDWKVTCWRHDASNSTEALWARMKQTQRTLEQVWWERNIAKSRRGAKPIDPLRFERAVAGDPYSHRDDLR